MNTVNIKLKEEFGLDLSDLTTNDNDIAMGVMYVLLERTKDERKWVNDEPVPIQYLGSFKKTQILFQKLLADDIKAKNDLCIGIITDYYNDRLVYDVIYELKNAYEKIDRKLNPPWKC